jgi:hypothetical protein
MTVFLWPLAVDVAIALFFGVFSLISTKKLGTRRPTAMA